VPGGWGKVCLLPISGRRVSAATDRLAQALPIMQRCIGCFEAGLHHIHLGSMDDTSSHDALGVCTEKLELKATPPLNQRH